MGKDMEDSVIEEIVAKQQPKQCAMLVYTVSSILTIYRKARNFQGNNISWITENC